MNIVWTPNARRTFFDILKYLSEKWTDREFVSFYREVEKMLKIIKQNPRIFPASQKEKNIRKALISKHTSLYYRINCGKDQLELLVFWDNRLDPANPIY